MGHTKYLVAAAIPLLDPITGYSLDLTPAREFHLGRISLGF